MREVLPYNGWIIARQAWKNRHLDGRSVTQCRVALLSPSKVQVARRLTEVTGDRYGVSHVNNYMSQAGSRDIIEALSKYPPGTVLVRAMDPGGTILGQSGWVPIPGQED